MKRLLAKSLLLCLLTISAIALSVMFIPVDHNSYFSASIDKHHLLSQSPSPKVVLVGGSNLAFSIDSARLQKEFGVPVVNMGLHANLGLRFMLDEVKSALNPSDIVVVVPEYQHFTGSPLDGTPKELAAVAEAYPRAFSLLNTPTQVANVAVGLLQLQGSKFNLSRLRRSASPPISYSRSAFNTFGDEVGHRVLSTTYQAKQSFWTSAPVYEPGAAILINQFAAEASDRGVRVLFVFPCIPITVYSKDGDYIESIASSLSNELTIPIIGTPSMFAFPDSYFFDSAYHMTGEGSTVRTDRILSIVAKPILSILARPSVSDDNLKR